MQRSHRETGHFFPIRGSDRLGKKFGKYQDSQGHEGCDDTFYVGLKPQDADAVVSKDLSRLHPDADGTRGVSYGIER